MPKKQKIEYWTLKNWERKWSELNLGHDLIKEMVITLIEEARKEGYKGGLLEAEQNRVNDNRSLIAQLSQEARQQILQEIEDYIKKQTKGMSMIRQEKEIIKLVLAKLKSIR